MIHGFLISHTTETADLIGRLVRTSGQIALDRVCCPFPGPYQITTTLQTLPVDVAFVDLAKPEEAAPVLDQLRIDYPHIAVVGFSTASLGGSGRFTEFNLSLPLSVNDLLATTRAAMCAGLQAYSGLLAIMPAKAGSGASTAAMNIAAQLAGSGRRVALLEADLRSGAIADWLGIAPRICAAETLAAADGATQLIWPMHVAEKERVDCILTNRNPQAARPEWHSYLHLLRFLKDRYDNVVVDLPELANDATSFVLEHASRVFLVSTAETLSLKLARQRVRELQMHGIAQNKIGLILNRWERGGVSAEDISKLLGCAVEAILPNDYKTVARAIHDESFVPSKSKLGQAYAALTMKLGSDRGPAPSAGSPGRWNLLRREGAPAG